MQDSTLLTRSLNGVAYAGRPSNREEGDETPEFGTLNVAGQINNVTDLFRSFRFGRDIPPTNIYSLFMNDMIVLL